MNLSDWKMLNSILEFSGVISIIAGVGLYFYSETGWLGVFYPYRAYSVPLVILGVIVAGVGYYIGQRAKQEQTEFQPTFSKAGYCIKCGEKRNPKANYCEKCGNKFE